MERHAMFTSIARPYKERSAPDTIAAIRTILERIDLVPEETFQANPFPQIYSASIQLPAEKGAFRTNGKGRNPAFCLASAYAEYMERMQNLLFATFSRTMIKQLADKFGFFYGPDEIYMNQNQFHALPATILSDFIRYSGQGKSEYVDAYFQRVAANGMPGVAALPFFDTQNRCVVHLPINLLLITAGSNGMAAGNTIAEAAFQAICELMERWSASLIYYRRMTPPTVPVSFISRFTDEMNIIRAIEEGGKYRVVVKDFSAGLQIPAVGVIIENRTAGSYRLNVGADTSFQVALSRCLTEIFQGIQDTVQFDQASLPIPEKDPDFFTQDNPDANFARFLMFTKFTKDGSGQFPTSLFGDTPDYPFQPEVFAARQSYAAEVRGLINFFHRRGYNVYLRDVSFLGFPSVFVYVPEVSAQGRKTAATVRTTQSFQIADLDAIETLMFNYGECSPKDLKHMATVFESFEPSMPVVNLFNIDLAPGSPWSQLSVAFLLSQMWYQLGDYEKSKQHFLNFMRTRADENEYYRSVAMFLDAKTKKKGTDTGPRQLGEGAAIGDQKLVEQILQDMTEPYRADRFTKFPQCPACDRCPLSAECLTRNKMKMASKVYTALAGSAIDQKSWSWAVMDSAK